MKILKSVVKKTFKVFGFKISRETTDEQKAKNISDSIKKMTDADLYQPTFSPWLGKKFQSYCLASLPYTLVSPDRLWVLYSLARQSLVLGGTFIECGVYKGGTALLLAKIIGEHNGQSKPQLHLFDTYEGMPEVNAVKDIHRKGDFSDTSFQAVSARLAAFPWAVLHKGIVPGTFKELPPESRIAFAHVDLDIHDAILGSCQYLYPRMIPGGVMIFDDYGFETCPGAREAVDKWFADKPEVPLVLATGQAIVIKLPKAEN